MWGVGSGDSGDIACYSGAGAFTNEEVLTRGMNKPTPAGDPTTFHDGPPRLDWMSLLGDLGQGAGCDARPTFSPSGWAGTGRRIRRIRPSRLQRSGVDEKGSRERVAVLQQADPTTGFDEGP